MFGSGYLGGGKHARLLFHHLHPRQGLFSVALKTARFGAGLPYSCTEHVETLAGQLLGGVHYLVLCLGRAGTCNYERPLCAAREVEGLQI